MGIKAVFIYYNIARVAKKFNIPLIIWGAGFGPFKSTFLQTLYRKFAIKFIEYSKISTFRDNQSIKEISRNNIKDVKPEPGYIWAARNKSKTINLDNKILGISFRSWPSSSKTMSSYINNKIHIFSNVIDEYIEKYHGNVLLIPMNFFHNGGDDRFALLEIYHNVKNKKNVSCHTEIYNASEILNFYKSCSLFIGMRFHSVMFATALGIPTIGIDYISDNSKISSFFIENDLHEYFINLQQLSSEILMKKLDSLIDNQNSLQNTLNDIRSKKIIEYDEYYNNLSSNELQRRL